MSLSVVTSFAFTLDQGDKTPWRITTLLAHQQTHLELGTSPSVVKKSLEIFTYIV
jgi:hypothetical protein